MLSKKKLTSQAKFIIYNNDTNHTRVIKTKKLLQLKINETNINLNQLIHLNIFKIYKHMHCLNMIKNDQLSETQFTFS